MDKSKSERNKLLRKLSGSSTGNKNGPPKKSSSNTKFERKRKVRKADRFPKPADLQKLPIPMVSKSRPKFSCAKQKPSLSIINHTNYSSENESASNTILTQLIKNAMEQTLKEQNKNIAAIIAVLLDKKIGAELKRISEEQNGVQALCKNILDGMSYHGSESNYNFVRLFDKLDRIYCFFDKNSRKKGSKKSATNGRATSSGRSDLTIGQNLQSNSKHTNVSTDTFNYSSLRESPEKKKSSPLRIVKKAERKRDVRKEKCKSTTVQRDLSCGTVLQTPKYRHPLESLRERFKENICSMSDVDMELFQNCIL